MQLRDRLARLKPQTTSREAILDDLRARMRRVLERTTPSRPPPTVTAEDSDFRLPFFAEPTDTGTLHRRLVRPSGAHRVGRMPTSAARDASPTLLSLLALDPLLASCDPNRALYLDTETTGLSGGTGTVAFLVGLAAFDEHGLFIEQLLVRNLGEEAPVLQHLRGRIEAASMLVTFNGKSFDMPLLRTRFAMTRTEAPPDRPHLDLLHVARRIHRRRSKLTALEERVLGWVREDDVPSGEVSERYLRFLRGGSESALLGVVEHNAQDVVSMVALLGLYGAPLDEGPCSLGADDLVGVADTLRRAGACEQAFAIASLASERGAGHEALRSRARIARALGHRDRALADLEALLEEVDCPKARLDLAKLYEHHVKDARRALELVAEGVAEDETQVTRRRTRLERKAARQLQEPLPMGASPPNPERSRLPAGAGSLPSFKS